MKKRSIKLIAWLISLVAALSACGGGGSPGAPAAAPSRIGPDTPVNPDTATWQTQQLGTWTDNIAPGNTYEPIGGEQPFALWLGGEGPGSALHKTVVVPGARGFTTTLLQPDLPNNARGNTTIAVTAGDWSMVAWTGQRTEVSAPYSQELLVRLKGPGVDSGPVLLSTAFAGSAWDTRLVLDATGAARVYWNEPDRSGVNGRFEAGRWFPQPDTGVWLLPLQRYLVGPDGQGWVFFSTGTGATQQHLARRLTATAGLGPAVRLDEAGWSPPSAQRVASAEDATSFTTVAYQGAQGCLAVRRMVNSVLRPTQCVMATGDALPNLNYVSLSTAPSGQAVLVWSTGTDDRALYAARRAANGAWGLPEKLADLPISSSYSLLSGLRTAMGPAGQALVVYRAPASSAGLSKSYAMVAEDGKPWSAKTELAYADHANAQAALAFNSEGVAGVLQLTINYNRSTDRYSSAVLMSTWRDGRWTSTAVASGIQLAYINGTPLSQVRLAPLGKGGWVAVWDEGKGPGDSSGFREIHMGEYR